jgi:hypothetical protein
MTLGAKNQGDFSSLDDVDGAWSDRSAMPIEFQSVVESLSSLEVGGATILVVALWYRDFSGSSIDGGD